MTNIALALDHNRRDVGSASDTDELEVVVSLDVEKCLERGLRVVVENRGNGILSF